MYHGMMRYLSKIFFLKFEDLLSSANDSPNPKITYKAVLEKSNQDQSSSSGLIPPTAPEQAQQDLDKDKNLDIMKIWTQLPQLKSQWIWIVKSTTKVNH